MQKKTLTARPPAFHVQQANDVSSIIGVCTNQVGVLLGWSGTAISNLRLGGEHFLGKFS